MRIISGKYKGRRINAPKNLPVRPTTDRAKESLFNILHNRIPFEETSVLDLFSGTGNILYECISRGVPKAVAVDKHYACTRFIKQTVKQLDTQAETQVFTADVFRFLQKTTERFDLIFADPPYRLSGISHIPELVFQRQLLNPEGILIIEHGKDTDLSTLTHFKELRRYGNVNFSIFQ